MVEMTYVDSSGVEAIGYDESAQELLVQFVGRGLYVYLGVPKNVFEEFLRADSKGSFFNRQIRPSYAFERRG